MLEAWVTKYFSLLWLTKSSITVCVCCQISTSRARHARLSPRYAKPDEPTAADAGDRQCRPVAARTKLDALRPGNGGFLPAFKTGSALHLSRSARPARFVTDSRPELWRVTDMIQIKLADTEIQAQVMTDEHLQQAQNK